MAGNLFCVPSYLHKPVYYLNQTILWCVLRNVCILFTMKYTKEFYPLYLSLYTLISAM